MNVAMDHWVLKIELDGEWEECSFATRTEALAAFTALAADYEANMRRAVLLPARAAAELLAFPIITDKTRAILN